MVSVRMSAVALCAAVMGVGAESAGAASLVGSGWSGAVLYDIDPSTGAASNPRSTHLDRLIGITSAGDGFIYGLSGRTKTLYRIDPGTGASEFVGDTGLSTTFEGDLDFDPTTGALYTVQTRPGLRGRRRDLLSISVDTGEARVVGTLPGSGDLSAMAFDSSGMLYLLDTGRDMLLTVDAGNAAVRSSLALSQSLGSVAGMDFDPASGLLYVTDGDRHGTGSLYTLDPASGILDVIGSTGLRKGFAGLQFVPDPALEPESAGAAPPAGGSAGFPEPGTLGLMAGGAAALFLRRRRG